MDFFNSLFSQNQLFFFFNVILTLIFVTCVLSAKFSFRFAKFFSLLIPFISLFTTIIITSSGY